MAKKEKQNYLDFVPLKNPHFPWEESEDGHIEVIISHTGFYHKIAQTFFHTPAKSHIALDQYGTFVWKQIDGKRTIFEISKLVGERFGKEAEPLLNRLVAFFQILRNHKFVLWKEAQK